jgi:hypothetical protein
MDARNPGGSSIKMSSSLNRSTFCKNCSQDAAVRCLCWSLPLTRILNRTRFWC